MEVHVEGGSHCSMPSCMTYDFLPFMCTGCSKKFCLEHSNPTAHDCHGDSITVIVCPVCEQSLKAAPGVDPDVLWMDHSEASCPGRRKRSKKKCPVCRTTLSIVNAFHCNLCAKDYCVKHRAQETHPCVESIKQVDTKKDEKSSGGDANTRASRKDRPKQDAPVGKSTLEFDDISAGLPSRVFVFNDDDDEDYGQRARLLNDKKRGKFSKMMLALSNLCSSKSQRRSQMRRRQSQFSPGPGADSVP